MLIQQVEELETLLKLQEQELTNLRGGDWQAEKEKCQERLAVIATEKQKLESEIEEIKSNKNAIQERYQNLQDKLSQERLLKTEMIGRKRYEVADIERINKELEYIDMEQEEIERLLQEKVDNLLAESKDKSEDIISLLEKKIASMKKEAKK